MSPAFREDHAQGRAEGGPGQHPEQSRRDQGIDEQGLKGGAGNGQRGADQGRRQDPGQPDIEQNIFQQGLLFCGQAGQTKEFPAGKSQQVGDRNPVFAEVERDQHNGSEEQGEQRQGQAFHRFSTSRASLSLRSTPRKSL